MARQTQPMEASVIERRLRPIYEWLDTGNNKKALQECDKVLKKNPKQQCCKALKALTLLRLNRHRESDTILEALFMENPTDDGTLQAMGLCYRENRQSSKVCSIYENAVKIDPTNEELATQLFMSYVKIGEFKAQQQSAIALYKLKPKNPYYCWMVISIILQANRGEGENDPTKRQVLLTLAERMMKKMVDEKKFEAEQEIQLYILVLTLLKKYEDILQLLESPLKDNLQTSNVPMLKLDYMIHTNKCHELNVLCKNLLQESADQWNVWKIYVKSVFDVMNLETKDVENVDDTPEKCHEFICSIIEREVENRLHLRSPYLSRFELCWMLQQKGLNSVEVLGDTIELFGEYFRNFAHKPCCVNDLKIYFKLLDAEQRSNFGSKIMKEVGIGPLAIPDSLPSMERHISALKIARMCGGHRDLSFEHLQALVTALVLHYQHGYQNYGKILLPTEIGSADNYAILACHIMYDLSRMPEGLQFLVGALALLETLIKNSPSNFHAKLLAVRFYHMLGDAVGANNMYNLLDIKHLQYDSLGYVHVGQLATTGMFSLCDEQYDLTLNFFSCNYKESCEHLVYSYKYGSFNKLEEFMDFRERIKNSMHYTTVIVDKLMLNIVECETVDAMYELDIPPKDENNIEFDKLRDNRDLNVFIVWEPEFTNETLADCEEMKNLFAQDKDFLQLRVYILWALAEAFQVLKVVNERVKHIENLREILKSWSDLENRVRSDDPKPTSEQLLAYPPSSRLHGYLKTPYRTCLTNVLEFFIALCEDDMTKAEETYQLAHQELETITSRLEPEVITGSSDFRDKRKANEMFVNSVELISVLCVTCVLCYDLVKPSALSKKGKKKQQQQQPTETKAQELVNSYVNETVVEINRLSELLYKWTNIVTEKDLITILDSLSLSTTSETLHRGFLESYGQSYREIHEVLKDKLKMVCSL